MGQDFERAPGPWHAEWMATPESFVLTAGSLHQAKFALDSSVRVLGEYNDYFGTPYPLPKLDNIASPGSSRFFSAVMSFSSING